MNTWEVNIQLTTTNLLLMVNIECELFHLISGVSLTNIDIINVVFFKKTNRLNIHFWGQIMAHCKALPISFHRAILFRSAAHP